MNSVVLIREVWDTRDLIGDVVDEAGQIKGSLLTRFEPEDLNALEMALQIKDQQGGKVTVLSAHAPRDVDVLREALYRDADEVIRIEDSQFESLDTLGLAKVFAQALQQMDDVQLVLTGISIPESENAFLANQVAAILGYPHGSYVDAVEEITEDSITCKRGIEGGYETVKFTCPAVLGIGVALLKDDPRTPRTAKARMKLKHKKTKIPTWDAAALNISATETATVLVKHEAVPLRAIETQEIDPEDESALKAMLAEWRSLR